MPKPVFTSASRVAFMIGHPVSHTAMPAQVNALAVREGVNQMMVPIDLPQDGLAPLIGALALAPNVDGAVVTAPYKAEMVGLLDEASDRVHKIGQANLIWFEQGRIYGDNTDGQGFVSALHAQEFSPNGARCLVFGAGGAGAAIVAELVMQGASEIDVVDMDAERAALLARNIGPQVRPVEAPQSVSDFDLIVNATAVGLDEVSTVHDLRGLRRDAMVADVLAAQKPTPFLQIAEGIGARSQTGKHMAFAQIPIVCKRFGWI